MSFPDAHIETLHNPAHYTHAQLETACAVRSCSVAASFSSSSRRVLSGARTTVGGASVATTAARPLAQAGAI
jgi:hypothetical protein